MGAHSVVGHGSARTVTAAAGMAAALATTATTGLLTGGTALATDGTDGTHGGHSHGGHSRSHGHQQVDQDDDTADVLAGRTLCDVLGDVPLGVGMSCPSGSSDGSDASDVSDHDGDGQVTPAARVDGAGAPRAGASPAPAAPRPRPTSTVPAQPQLLPITGSR